MGESRLALFRPVGAEWCGDGFGPNWIIGGT